MDKVIFDDKTGKVLVAVHMSNSEIIEYSSSLPSIDITEHPDKERILQDPAAFKVIKQGGKFEPTEKTDKEKKADKDALAELLRRSNPNAIILDMQKQIDDLKKEVEQLKKK